MSYNLIMTITNDYKSQINQEFQQALKARSLANEGQARVCARRAAGIAIGEYLKCREISIPDPSAIKRLRFLINLPGISPKVIHVSEHLLLKVNQDFKLPLDIDLVEEAKWLVQELLGESY